MQKKIRTKHSSKTLVSLVSSIFYASDVISILRMRNHALNSIIVLPRLHWLDGQYGNTGLNLINKRHGSRILDSITANFIDPTDKFTSMNLYKILCVVTSTWLFLTSMEAVRGQTPYRDCTLWHFNSMFSPSHSAKVCGCCTMVFGL